MTKLLERTMKASELVEVLKAAIEKHGDHNINIIIENDNLPEVILEYRAPVGEKSWHVTVLTSKGL